MIWHIVLEETDEPVGVPDAADLANLHAALDALADAVKASGTMPSVYPCLVHAVDDLHDAASEQWYVEHPEGRDDTCVLCDAGEEHEH